MLTWSTPSLVFAHGGEDHGDAKPSVTVGIGPRLAIQSDQFWIVVVPTAKDGGKLQIHLSDAVTNGSIVGAQIEVTRGEATSKAMQVKGFYEVAAPFVSTPGHYDLTLAVNAGDRSDLLIGTLDIPEPPTIVRHDSVWDHILPQGSLPAAVPFLSILAGLAGLLACRRMSVQGAALRRVAVVVASGFVVLGLSAGAFGVARNIRAKAQPANAILDQPVIARRLDDGGVFVPRPTQALLDIATVNAPAAQTAQKTVRLIGQVIPDLNRSGLVQSLLAGRIEAPERGFPSIVRAVYPCLARFLKGQPCVSPRL